MYTPPEYVRHEFGRTVHIIRQRYDTGWIDTECHKHYGPNVIADVAKDCGIETMLKLRQRTRLAPQEEGLHHTSSLPRNLQAQKGQVRCYLQLATCAQTRNSQMGQVHRSGAIH